MFQLRSTRRMAVAAGLAATSAAVTSAASAEEKPKFQRLSPIQFIAALGDPTASSGTGAQDWGLWREDPGPQGARIPHPRVPKSKVTWFVHLRQVCICVISTRGSSQVARRHQQAGSLTPMPGGWRNTVSLPYQRARSPLSSLSCLFHLSHHLLVSLARSLSPSVSVPHLLLRTDHASAGAAPRAEARPRG